MSLLAHRNLKATKLLAATGRDERASVALAITAIVSPVRKAIMRGARLFSDAMQAIAEAAGAQSSDRGRALQQPLQALVQKRRRPADRPLSASRATHDLEN